MSELVRACLLPLLLGLSVITHGQVNNDALSLDTLLPTSVKQAEPSRLHLHIDKTIYTANETLWFSAYVYALVPDTFQHQLLFVKLVRDDNDSLIRSLIFPIKDNHSAGSMLLPTNIATGHYRLIAYTDKLRDGTPAVVFRQRLQVKTEVRPNYAISLQVADSTAKRTDSLTLLVKGQQGSGAVLRNVTCRYELFADAKRVTRGKFELDNEGKAFVTIPRLPGKAITFKTLFTADGNKEEITLPVRQPSGRPLLSFYPEGGTIIQNTRTNLPVEVVGKNGEPVICSISLYDNNRWVSTINTNARGYGFLQFSALEGHRYEARITDRDSSFVYALPEAKPSGYSLQLKDGVVQDSLQVILQKKAASEKSKLLLHNFKTVFWAADITARPEWFTLSIPVDSIPTGLYALTLLDEVNRPVAERLCFIHHDQQTLKVQADKAVYGVREKVGVQVLFDATVLHKKDAQLSFSCTDINRLDLSLHPNILSSFFINDVLDAPFGAGLYFLAGQKQVLQELLLTKGWRSYSIDTTLLSVNPMVAITTLHPGKGMVVSKKEKGPFEVGLFTDDGFNVYRTDSAGHFSVPLERLVAAPEKHLYLAPVKKQKKQPLSIQMDTAFIAINRRMDSVALQPIRGSQSAMAFSNKDVLLSDGIKTLSVVTVQAKKTMARFISKSCKDWVCQYNILNCQNHPSGSTPIDGETYLYREHAGAPAYRVVYVGCGQVSLLAPKAFITLNKISVSKTFYKSNYEGSSFTEPEYLSTLYWNPQLSIQEGRFQDTFFTSDAKGTFLCIVEGIVDGRPVYAQYRFQVK